ncbi:hypothetical protein BASA61_007854 [Batrachochytrium salamandrivorans]|nr:hypothetical protein BASA61_007854 [Batrachochytrium salamandrivorans]
MWVSFDSKQNHYDGKANPYPDLDHFRKTYAGMTDEQFSLGLTRIFNRMRDKHTLFYKAGPYGCFSVYTGLLFNFVDNSLGSSTPSKVRVVGMTDTPEALDLIGDVLSTIDIGDELLTVNEVPFHDWYDQNKFILGFGANDSGGHSGAFQYLEQIAGSSNILPEDDSITFQLRRLGGRQAVYTVKVPYVALSNDECWDLSSSLYKELNSIALPEIPAPTIFKQKRSVLTNGASLPGNDTLHRRDTDIHKRSYSESVRFKDTSIDGLTWAIWKNGERNMGVIKIDSFTLVLKDTKKDITFLFLILTIRDLLVNQLKDTDAILLDIRGNPGGSISSADGIIQLFRSDATASQFRYLKNDATESLFYKGLNSKNPWSKAWSETSDTSRYSGFGSLYDSSILNTFGQVYFNPVGVYTNGACYSTCEIFASHIQDYDPFTKRLTGENLATNSIPELLLVLVNWSEVATTQVNLLKIMGVKSNVVVRSTIADILPGYKSVSAYNRIADYLGDVAKRQMDSKVYFMSEPYDRVTFEDSMDIPAVVSGIDEIIVVNQGEELGSWKGELSALHQKHVITVKTPTGLHSHLIAFVGKKQGTQVFKTYREITRVPTSNDQINMMTANSYTVSGPSSSTGVYNFAPTSEQKGWDFNDGKWVIGDGVSDYYGHMSSTIRVWFIAPVGSTISVSLDAVVDTPEKKGHFSLDVMDNSGDIVPMVSPTSDDKSIQSKSITGRNRVIKETYYFTVTTEKIH